MTLPPPSDPVVDVDLSGVREVLVRHGVQVAWLFGSRAEGTARAGSDVDMGVLLPEGASWLAGEEVASALRSILPVDVDVVDLRTASLELQAKVVQTGRLLHSTDEVRRVRFVTDTRSRWFDFAPFQRRLAEAYLARVADRGFQHGRP
ncbi:MAG TPA: nucleotidyltransferase domain-containing protein [Euzebya sp.]|nr:nucleotidyltransferase domain-containing protein [Euzebya sp.]